MAQRSKASVTSSETEAAVKNENNEEVVGQKSSKLKKEKKTSFSLLMKKCNSNKIYVQGESVVKPNSMNLIDPAVNGRAKRKNNETEPSSDEDKKKKPKLSEVQEEEEDLGNALVDIECVQMLGKAHVFSENGNTYDAMLNQTNIQNNSNKYFLLQLLVDNPKKSYFVWFRWGRVGFRGQSSLTKCGGDVERAKRVFEQKFRDKTGNCFSDRKNFIKYGGKYDLIKIDYNDKKKARNDMAKNVESVKNKGKKEKVPEKSKLEPRIKHVMELIFDVKSMERDLRNMEYDVNKCPLGSISKAQVKEGFKALTQIQEHIQSGKFNSDFVNAVNDYYTQIPHCFGMRVPPQIRTLDHLKREITLLETMSEIELAMTSNKEELTNSHPLDSQYNFLRYNFKPLERECSTVKIIDQYLNSTHGSTHSLQMTLKGVFELEYRDASHSSRFRADVGNRKLLWHGSRMTNWFGILSQGLRIAPPEAPSTGYMFGKGVYFADSSSKSANYSMIQPGQSIFMVLSEVALGQTNELKLSDSRAHLLPPGKNSVHGVGRYIPSKKTSLDDGLVVPMGPLIENQVDGLSLFYNEYIVYDTNQIKERFLVEIDASFDFTL